MEKIQNIQDKNSSARLIFLRNISVSNSPHIGSGDSIKKTMWTVIIALLPAVFASYIFFGLKALGMIAVSVVTAVLLEAGIQILRHKPVTITDGSAIITGILLAFNLSPAVPYWIVILGAGVAIIIGKQVFGGLGHNIFNPALVGRVFLLAAYPSYMTRWTLDGITCATPLAVVKEKIATALPGYWSMFAGHIGGCIGETSALALLIGGIFLLSRKIITWHIPVTYIGTVGLLMYLFGKNPFFHILAGGLMLGAIFMATDMVTSPVTPLGMIIFGVGAGLLTTGIRLFGKYPEGVSYSILFMNACTPLIDRYCRPRRFGLRHKGL